MLKRFFAPALTVFALTLAFAPLASLAAAQSYHTECTGGTITHANGYTIHTFAVASTTSTSFTCPQARSVEYLVVAGGGGGLGSTGGGGGLNQTTINQSTIALDIPIFLNLPLIISQLFTNNKHISGPKSQNNIPTVSGC